MSFYAILSRSVNFSDCDRTLLSRGHVEYIYLFFLLFALKPSLHVESSANAIHTHNIISTGLWQTNFLHAKATQTLLKSTYCYNHSVLYSHFSAHIHMRARVQIKMNFM